MMRFDFRDPAQCGADRKYYRTVDFNDPSASHFLMADDETGEYVRYVTRIGADGFTIYAIDPKSMTPLTVSGRSRLKIWELQFDPTLDADPCIMIE